MNHKNVKQTFQRSLKLGRAEKNQVVKDFVSKWEKPKKHNSINIGTLRVPCGELQTLQVPRKLTDSHVIFPSSVPVAQCGWRLVDGRTFGQSRQV